MKYIDVWFSHGVHASKIFLTRLFLVSFFSSLLSLSQTHTHTYILVPFIIHDLLDGRRLCLRRIRHSWLCVLEPNMCVEKRLFFSSVVYPPSPSCLVSSLHSMYHIYIYIYVYIYSSTLIVFCTCIVDVIALLIKLDCLWRISRFFFLSFLYMLFHTFTTSMSFM
jgi:hypothetical protein